jgi:hypothetical protein
MEDTLTRPQDVGTIVVTAASTNIAFGTFYY